MSIAMAIALLCSYSGGSLWFRESQVACQKKLAACVLKNGMTEKALLICVGDQ